MKKALADIRLDMEALKKLITWRNQPPLRANIHKIHLVPKGQRHAPR